MSDGTPYATLLYENIVKERYIISNILNTSYTDTASITPTERKLIMKYMKEDLRRKQENMEAARQQAQMNKAHSRIRGG